MFTVRISRQGTYDVLGKEHGVDSPQHKSRLYMYLPAAALHHIRVGRLNGNGPPPVWDTPATLNSTKPETCLPFP